MSRGRWIQPLAVFFALTGLLALGCGEDPSRPGGATDQQPDINDEVGGYTSQNEQPAFGDASLQASGDAESAQDDAMAQDADVIRIRQTDSTHVYMVTMHWGIFRDLAAAITNEDENPGEPVDWTGHLELNRGAVIVASTIAWERSDQLLLRTDRRRVDWVSHTTGSFDGIRLLVYQPFEEGNTGSTDTMTVVAGAYSGKFAVNDLAELSLVVPVGTEGDRFAIRSFRVNPRLSSAGFLGGAWTRPEIPGGRGTFMGRWISMDGRLAGFVKGFHGVNARGEKVFFGKYIDRNGIFRGFLAGRWDESGPDVTGRIPMTFGWFRGHLLDAGKIRIGAVRGAWRSASEGRADGFFEGVWKIGV